MITILKFIWAWVLPYAGPLLVWIGPKLARLAGLGTALGLPSGLALPVVAGGLIATTLALGIGWMGWRHVRETRAETAFVQRCNGVILAANSKAYREALGRASASEDAAALARQEVATAEKKVADLQQANEDLLAGIRKLGAPVPRVCLPVDILAKALGG